MFRLESQDLNNTLMKAFKELLGLLLEERLLMTWSASRGEAADGSLSAAVQRKGLGLPQGSWPAAAGQKQCSGKRTDPQTPPSAVRRQLSQWLPAG